MASSARRRKHSPLLTAATPLLLIAAAALVWNWLGRGKETDTGVAAYDFASAVHRQFSGEKALAHAGKLVGFGPRIAGSDALEESRRYCEEVFQSHGWSTKRQAFEENTPRGPVRFINLRARFFPRRQEPDDGGWEKRTRLVVGSHYDTKFYPDFTFVGANDSASSTGALLECARCLAANPAVAAQLELVLFDGEEAFGVNISPTDGLYGSRHYARAMRRLPREQRAQYGIVLDMIGDKDLDVRVPSDSPRMLSRKLFQAAAELGFPAAFGTAPNPIIDDHVPLNQAGIPTLDVIDLNYQPWWHTEGDTLDKLSPKSLEIVGRTVLLLIEKYLLPFPGQK